MNAKKAKIVQTTSEFTNYTNTYADDQDDDDDDAKVICDFLTGVTDGIAQMDYARGL